MTGVLSVYPSINCFELRQRFCTSDCKKNNLLSTTDRYNVLGVMFDANSQNIGFVCCTQ